MQNEMEKRTEKTEKKTEESEIKEKTEKQTEKRETTEKQTHENTEKQREKRTEKKTEDTEKKKTAEKQSEKKTEKKTEKKAENTEKKETVEKDSEKDSEKKTEKKTPRNDEWKQYNKGLTRNIALDDLEESIRVENVKKLEKAIIRCRESGLRKHPRVLDAQDFDLPTIKAKIQLKKACKVFEKNKKKDDTKKMKKKKKKPEEEDDEDEEEDEEDDEEEDKREPNDEDVKKVKKVLRYIREEEMTSELLVQVREAKLLLQQYDRQKLQKEEDKKAIRALAMNSRTVAEIRRYQNPPSVLHEVVKGVLLLLGEDEGTTKVIKMVEVLYWYTRKDWQNCQRICNPHGADGLCRKVLAFKASKVNREIMARAKEIMHKIEFDDVQAVGKGAPVSFYVWAMGAIEDSEPKSSKKEKKGKGHDKNKTGKPIDSSDEDDRSEKSKEEEEEEEAKPANIKRQKEIFGHTPRPTENTICRMNIKKKDSQSSEVKKEPSKPEEHSSKGGQKSEVKKTNPEETSNKDGKSKSKAHGKASTQENDDKKSEDLKNDGKKKR